MRSMVERETPVSVDLGDSLFRPAPRATFSLREKGDTVEQILGRTHR